jgi:histidine-containing phosphotransfer protein
VVDLYFEDSASKIEKMAIRLQEPVVDYNEMDQIVHQFKGSSASFGARTMAMLCIQLRDACHQQNQVCLLAGWLELCGWGAVRGRLREPRTV